MSTQIKRLYQSNKEFVPITLQEAVVVNSTNIPGLQSLGITTLDKVLRQTMGIVSTNTGAISTLETTVANINTELGKKQNQLVAGTGITLTPLQDGRVGISTSLSYELYKVVTELPAPSAECYLATAKHLLAINNLQTVEELINYDYTKGYPEKLTFNV